MTRPVLANFEFKSQQVAEEFMHLNAEGIEIAKAKAEAEKTAKTEETRPQ